MLPKIYISKKIPHQVETYLSKHCEYRKWDGDGSVSRDLLLQEVADIEGLLTHAHLINEELLARAPKLKVVSNISVGYNNFDLKAMKRRGVIGTNTPGVLDETTADLVFALMLAAGRRISELDQYVKDGKWDKLIGEDLYGVDIHHKVLGIIGLGRIGEAIARRGRFGFNMEIIYSNRTKNLQAENDFDARFCALEELLRTADYVVLMTPLTPATVKLIGRKEFALMKSSAIFVNGSRGETVDETALTEALMNGTIRGAGIDVYENEPTPPDNPLLSLPNVITVPHIGSAVQQTRDRMAMVAAENLVSGLSGKIPPNIISE